MGNATGMGKGEGEVEGKGKGKSERQPAEGGDLWGWGSVIY